MKKIILFMFLFFPLVLIAQQDSLRHDTLILDKFFNLVGRGIKKTFKNDHKDSTKNNHKDSIKQKLKLDFSCELGTQYNSLLRDHYFPLDTPGYHPEIMLYRPVGRVGITYKPSFGYHTNLTCDYIFKRNFKIESGLQLNYRKETYIEDNDTNERNIVNIFNLQHNTALDTFKSFQHSYFDIIVPVYFGYSYKRFSSFVGLKLPIFTFARTQYTTLHNLEFTRFKSNQFFYNSGSISIKFEYLIFNKKFNISSYLAIDDRGRKYYDFLIGLKFKFHSLN